MAKKPTKNKKIATDDVAEGLYKGTYSLDKPPVSIYEYNTHHLTTAVHEGFSITADIKYTYANTALVKELNNNIRIFSAAKTWQQTKEMNEALVKDGQQVSLADFKKSVAEISGTYNENYLESEYNYTIASASHAANWVRFEAEKNELSLLEWSTTGDACPECEEMDGVTCPFDAPVWDIAPPVHPNCMCILLQRDSDEHSPTPDNELDIKFEALKEHSPPAFRNNSGRTAEIFNDKHPYFEVPKEYAHLAENNFNLPK
jgi:hypothetical protein